MIFAYQNFRELYSCNNIFDNNIEFDYLFTLY